MVLIFLIPVLCLDLDETLNSTLAKDQNKPFTLGARNKELREEQGDQLGSGSVALALVEFTRPDIVNKTDTDQQHPRLHADDKPDYKVYNFKDSGIGESWMLGDDSTSSANAFIEGYSKCPKDITVPRSLTNVKGVTRYVEVIGRYAYNNCGRPQYGANTRTVLVTKQVKIIKTYGFGNMHDVESFRIEEGSVLESVENAGMHWIGYNTGINDGDKRGTLTLPSTLSSVARHGIYNCNLFEIITYCGIHSLTNSCELYYGVEKTKVKVTSKYLADTIFGLNPLKDSPTEVEGNCFKIALKPKPSLSISPSPSSSLSFSVSPSPFPTPTPSFNYSRSPFRKTTLHLAALFIALLPSQSLSIPLHIQIQLSPLHLESNDRRTSFKELPS